MSYKDALKKGNELVIATSYNNRPHLIVVISLGITKDRLLFGICQSYSTLRNIKKNKSICLYVKYDRKYYRIKGKAILNLNKKDLDNANKMGKGPKTKCLVSVKISEVFDLDNLKKIDL